ncbi:MAG: flavin reductase family protein [bacterium]
MIIEPQGLTGREAYKLMISLVVPRPIAWVTSMGPGGAVNAAPFSYFNGVTSRPPIVAVSVAQGREGPKDTARNIESRGRFVVNFVDEEHAEDMNRTATEYPYGVSEPEEVGLELVGGETADVPGLAASPARIECSVVRIIPVGDPPAAHILGRVEAFLLAEGITWDRAKGVDPGDLRLIGRMGQNRYCTTRDLLTIDRIPYPPDRT